jgi:hypothetical protein
LYPSIGNWNLSRQSHYRIRNNIVSVGPPWTAEQIRYGFRHDQRAKDAYYRKDPVPVTFRPETPSPELPTVMIPPSSWIDKLWERLFGR